MGMETWLNKVKKTMLNKKLKVGVLAFEAATIMSKLNHMWQNLADQKMTILHNETICLQGVKQVVSTNDVFLLSLACAEMVENLKVISKTVSRLSQRCQDSKLRGFDAAFDGFANTDRDPYSWTLSMKEMEIKSKKMVRYASATATLRRLIDELTVVENSLMKSLHYDKSYKIFNDHAIKQNKILDLQQKIKCLKEKSLWNKSFDKITSLLARSVFTILSRIKFVFNLNHGYHCPPSLPRSLSASAIHPSDQALSSLTFVSGPLMKSSKHEDNKSNHLSHGFFERHSKVLKPSSTTLGAAALALHYANLIIVTEKMIKSPELVSVDARDDVYMMLTSNIRTSLRRRLKGVRFTASDPVLAGEWRDAVGVILGWLSPLAHNMMKWQSERCFEHQNVVPKTGVLLLQTLFFADQEETEDAITELLVGLNYIWRFDNAKAFLNCRNFKNVQEY